MIQIETTYKTIGLATYLEKSRSLLKLVNQHEEGKKMYSIKKYSGKFKKELNIMEMKRKSTMRSPIKNYCQVYYDNNFLSASHTIQIIIVFISIHSVRH